MESDITQSEGFWKLWAWFEKNKKQVIYGAVAASVVALIVWYFVWRAHERQVEAGEALSKVNIGQMMTPSGATQDFSQAYLKVAADHAGSAAAERALLLAGGNLFTLGKFAEAQTQFGRFIREYGGSPLLPQAKLGMAASLESQGKTNDALNAYKEVAERYPNASATPQSKFALARLYEAQNQPQQARKYFEEVARSDAGSSLGSEAGIRLEELNIKFPPPAPTNAPSASAAVPALKSPAALPTPAAPAKK